MVEPTFEDARFATNPALEEAGFLTNIDASVEERYRRWELVLVHPESLENTDVSVPVDATGPDFSVPMSLTHLAAETPQKTKAFVDALGSIDSQDWHDVVDDALPVARTGATRLDDPTSGVLVFGFVLGERGLTRRSSSSRPGSRESTSGTGTSSRSATSGPTPPTSISWCLSPSRMLRSKQGQASRPRANSGRH